MLNADQIRAKILEINKNGSLSQDEKATRIREVMLGSTRRASSEMPPPEPKRDEEQPIGPEHPPLDFEKEATHRAGTESLGCKHYLRGCKMRCATCHTFHTCRLCHDEWSAGGVTADGDPRPSSLRDGHTMDRHAVSECMCMSCGWHGPSARECGLCGAVLGKYFCARCNLWDSTPGKSIYHCDGRHRVRRRKATHPRGDKEKGAKGAGGKKGKKSIGKTGAEDESNGSDGDGDDVKPNMDDDDDGDGSSSSSSSSASSSSDGDGDGSASESYEYVFDADAEDGPEAASGGCGICRVGRGLGIDYKHCSKCNMCVPINTPHKCVSNALETACPICSEELFHSRQRITLTKCGHPIHEECLHEYALYARENGLFVTCPTCRKTLYDETPTYRYLDAALAQLTMPEEYKGKVSSILCNDCELTGEAPFHFQYHKCPHCDSYNTTLQ